MQLRRRRGAAALAAAVISGVLGSAPGALAAPSNPSEPVPPTADATDRKSTGNLPAVWPKPQSIQASGSALPIGDEVILLADDGADPYAIDTLRTLLRTAGARTITELSDADPLPARGLVVRAGDERTGQATHPIAGGPTRHRGSGADRALRALKAPEQADLPSGGYRIATGKVAGRDTVVLAGVGADGLFHAVQSLRQLISGSAVPGVRIRDWPTAAVRGMTEGFYGTPWTREQRLAQLDFMGRTKQNRYLYAPGDDPYRQARWREPYPAAQRAEFRALAERARENHVTLAWAVAPGQAMCLSSDDDVKALNRKLDAMWALGVRAFQLQFQDVSYSEWHCRADRDTFGSGPDAAAAAQARVAGAVADHLAERYGDAAALSLLPTEHYQEGSTAYRRALARKLDGGVQVAWTGVGVVPKTITGRELAGAREAFGHPLVTMDNYSVNDYAQDRIFLGPYLGREPAVAAGSVALLSNAMEQAAASRIPLFTAADYAWNPKQYRPQESWRAAIDDLAATTASEAAKTPDTDRSDTKTPDTRTTDAKATREAVHALAGNTASSVLGSQESAYLRPLMEDFFTARGSTDKKRVDAAAKKLRDAFTVLRESPQRLEGTPLGAEVGPWLEQLSWYGTAGEYAVDLLHAQSRGDGAAAWTAERRLKAARDVAKSGRATVGKGVLDPFLDRVQKESATWTGASRQPAKPERDDSSHTVRIPRPRPLDAVVAMTEPGAAGSIEAHVPGEGWRRLGELAPSGWTETAARDLRADAVRVTWQGEPGKVERLVPWFADTPDAEFRLPRTETDAEIGGGPRRVTAKLTSQRRGEADGKLTAKPPKGIKVRTPKESVLPRGTEVAVPVEVTVPKDTPAGEYQVPLTFGDQTHTLTVRAFPRASGPDLARGARAASSADETEDFPASAANDGDPTTRWSSPAEDNSWWQLELTEPVRLGQVTLHWQDAYAKAYRVQVSPDGKTWRTAATVRDGRGGRETVRMDAPDARYVRVQGDRRATEYGYSLWSVEAYAVQAEEPKPKDR
ncbi:beta-N-acetylglucosaminidase domain-containing protein [Streptomyces sp. E11-3]|uniref:beta-N-acetylglucosaminidase domain-containing protein n=1 Tax=Streptomyces sp. E11-3 TaxID=3110112 RepID=UPI003980BC64